MKLVSTRILFGDEGLNEISSHDDVDIVVAAIVGFQCLKAYCRCYKYK